MSYTQKKGFVRRNGRKIIAVVVVLVLVIIGVRVIKRVAQKDESYAVSQSYAVVVSTQKVVKQEASLTLPYLAVVENDKDVLLSTKIPARILSIKKSGSKIRIGEVVARLDNTSIKSSINSVNAQLKSLEISIGNMNRTHSRTSELLAIGGASVEESQKEENMIAQLVSKKEMLTQKLSELNNMSSYTTITSPIRGTISKTMLHAGDMAMPRHPIAMLQAKKGFYLLLRLPSTLHVSAVMSNGKRHKVIPLNSVFHGLAEYKVYADIPHVRSGDRVEVSVEVYHGMAIKLPFDALLNREGESFVLVRKGNHAVAKKVSIIATGEEGVVVSDDSLENSRIVVEKQDILLKLLTGIAISVKGEIL